jgi:hypothetical protein
VTKTGSAQFTAHMVDSVTYTFEKPRASRAVLYLRRTDADTLPFRVLSRQFAPQFSRSFQGGSAGTRNATRQVMG